MPLHQRNTLCEADLKRLRCSLAFLDVARPADAKLADLVWVEDLESLRALADTLEQQTTFALDLEHHSEHSYLGFTCLLQISAGCLLWKRLCLCPAMHW